MKPSRILLTIVAMGAISAAVRLGATRTEAPAPPSLRLDSFGVVIGGVDPDPNGGPPLNIDNIISSAESAMIVSTDSRDTFVVPVPGDAQWTDYIVYRRAHRSALDNSPGYAVPYDPEWRSDERGYRENVSEPFLRFYGGAATLADALGEVVKYLNYDDPQALVDLAIHKEEFSEICWPSMPQARPYLRIPWKEAWGFQYANILGGIREGQRQRDDRDLQIDSIEYGAKKELPYYTLFSDLVIHTSDKRSGEKVELTFVDSVVEYDGVYKVFMYRD